MKNDTRQYTEKEVAQILNEYSASIQDVISSQIRSVRLEWAKDIRNSAFVSQIANLETLCKEVENLRPEGFDADLEDVKDEDLEGGL